MNWIIEQTIDLAAGSPQMRVWPNTIMLLGDNQAHTWRVNVLKNGQNADLSGYTVQAYFVRRDNQTVMVPGSIINGCTAACTLDQSCYAIPGDVHAVMRISKPGEVITLAVLALKVRTELTNAIIDPGHAIPTLDELLAQIADCEAAAQGAREQTEAAETAETGRADAESARVQAETGRADAEDARVQTETGRAGAEDARVQAETGRADAESARAQAETGRADAESARVQAETGRADAEDTRAQAETDRAGAENARVQAETGRADAESARVQAETGRTDAESARAQAETGRAEDFARFDLIAEPAPDGVTVKATSKNGSVTEATVRHGADAVVDPTLTQDGQAADAGATGRALAAFQKVEAWADVHRIVEQGLASAVFPVGTQLRVTHSTYGEIVFDVVAHDHNKVVGNDQAHTMTLLSHACIVNALQYDGTEALYAAEEGLPAGTYNFTLLGGYDPTYGGGKTYQFTLAQSVPAGGVIMFPWGYQRQAAETQISTYASNASTAAIETVPVTEGTGGTALGTADGSEPRMNHTHRVRYGSNNWAESAMRQWLNSAAEAGSVWVPKTKFDRPPSWASNTAGFAAGLPEDFLAVCAICTHPNKTNGVYELGHELNTTYNTEDRFYLVSHSEVFGGADGSVADGTLLPFFAAGTASGRIKYNTSGTARYWWLRSPYPWIANDVRLVNPDGSLNGHNAYHSSAVAAACDIF